VVNVDRLRQQQVLRNLVSNATKYGGPHIRLRGRVDGEWYVWTVADDGDGVPPELEERLFQRFIHQHSFQQAVAVGVGLGLSIVTSLAEGMGGTVSYEKTISEARFIIRVPLAIEEASAVEAAAWTEPLEEGAA
jgi:signal transduction histidine kinase